VINKPPANKKDETGNKYGRLIVLWEDSIRGKSGCVRWVCMCDCGKEIIVDGSRLRNGNVKSCGCLLGTYEAHILPVTIHNYRRYINGAKKKGREFTLTVDEFQELILQP